MSAFARRGIYVGAMVVGAMVAVVAAVVVPLAAAPAPLTCPVENPTIVGTPGRDELEGTEGDDIVSLGAGDDRFRGRGGDDVVCGDAGTDELHGGAGDDRLFGDRDYDSLHGDSGSDYLDGGPTGDILVDDEMMIPAAPAEDGADVLLGGGGGDDLHLSAGDGVGGGSPDEADGGAGEDSVSYEYSPVGVEIEVATATGTGDAVDRFVSVEAHGGSGFSDTLVGTAGDDVLRGGRSADGPDRLQGRAGNDVLEVAESAEIEAGPGNDVVDSEAEGYKDVTVNLGDGDDKMTLWMAHPLVVRGGPGDDTFVVNEHGDNTGVRGTVDGGRGEDRLEFLLFRPVHLDLAAGEAMFVKGRLLLRHINEILGSFENDTLLGSAEDDVLHGRDGDDVLRGRGGPDHLVGDSGIDVAYGDSGSDTCEAERVFSC